MFLVSVLFISLPLLALLAASVFMIRVAGSLPRIGPDHYSKKEDGRPLISVIVPARNEESRIGACLKSLLAQDYPELEFRIVDDQSTDRTAEIVRELALEDERVVLVQGQPLPTGWLGKPHAIWQGVEGAEGEYLCFIDADVRLHPQCVRQALGCLKEHGADMITLGMRLECPGFWEKAVQPLMVQLILMGFPADKVNDQDSEVASANGPFMMLWRDAYEAMGGHQEIRGEIVEDLALARRVKEQGFRLLWALAPELISVRMYATLKEIWQGWSKNFFRSLDEKLSLAILAGVGTGWLFLLPWLCVLWSGWELVFGPERVHALVLLVLSLTTVIIHARQRRWISSVYGVTSAGVVLQPLGALIVIGIVINSTLKVRLGGEVAWKGRTYPGGRAE